MTAASAVRSARVTSLHAPASPPKGPFTAMRMPGILPGVPLDRRGRPLIGRTDALTAIRDASVHQPGPNVVVVTGEAGIGKSRLLDHVIEDRRARRLARADRRLRRGQRRPDPVRPDRRARCARCGARSTTRTDPGRHRHHARQPGAARRRAIWPSCSSTHCRSSSGCRTDGPLVFALEDLHWADAGTLDMISFLLRNLDGDALLLLTYRDEDWHRSPALSRLTEHLVRSRQVTRVELARLTRDELAELSRIGDRLGRPRTPNSTRSSTARRATRSSPRSCSWPTAS